MLQITGLNKLAKKFKAARNKIENPTDFYRGSIVFIDKWIQDNFKIEGKKAYPGKGWEPLAPKTLKARERGWGNYIADTNPRILQNKGFLKSKWRHAWTSRQGLIESGVEYGEIHDTGAPAKNLPQRKILPTEKMIMPDLVKILNHFIGKAFK